MAKRPAISNTLSPHIIRYLTSMVIARFKEEYLSLKDVTYDYVNDASLFGYGNYDSDDVDSIRTFVCRNEEVKEVVKQYIKTKGLPKKDAYQVIEGNYLWKKNYLAQNSPETAPIPFKEHYRDIFLKYIGRNLAEIEKAYLSSYTYYVGIYMSFAEFQIKTLLISISQVGDEKGRYKIIVEGIHAKKGAKKEEKYEGQVWEEEGWLYGYAKIRDTGRRLSLMGSVHKQEEISNNQFIKAFLQGITLDEDRLFSWEVLFCKTTKEAVDQHRASKLNETGPVNQSIVSEDNLRLVKLYLVLHRNVMTFESEVIDSLEQLAAKGTNVGKLAHIKGTYRLWNFDFEFENIIQSKFSVLDDEIGTLKTMVPPKERKVHSLFLKTEDKPWRTPITPTLQEQKSLINISKAHDKMNTHKVVVITFNGIDIVNVAMLDFPMNSITTETILPGSFSTLSDQLHGNISGYFVMKKEVDKNFEVKTIPINDILQYAKNENLVPFLHVLLKLVEENERGPILNINSRLEQLQQMTQKESLLLTQQKSPPSYLEDDGNVGYTF